MNKYIVVVNGRYLVPVAVDGSACAAEHVILDQFADEINKWNVIDGCLAFAASDLGSESFRAFFQEGEFMNLVELQGRVEYVVAQKEEQHKRELEAIDLFERVTKAARELEELNAKLEKARRAAADGRHAVKKLKI